MPSIGTQLKQRLTGRYVVTQDSSQGAERGPYFFNQADVDSWLQANGSKIVHLGGGIYIIPGTASGSTFEDVLEGNNGATGLNPSLPDISQRKTVVDLGKEIIIGNAYETRLLVLRLVNSYASAADGLGGYTGYIVVENNDLDLSSTTGRFLPRVARI